MINISISLLKWGSKVKTKRRKRREKRRSNASGKEAKRDLNKISLSLTKSSSALGKIGQEQKLNLIKLMALQMCLTGQM